MKSTLGAGSGVGGGREGEGIHILFRRGSKNDILSRGGSDRSQCGYEDASSGNDFTPPRSSLLVDTINACTLFLYNRYSFDAVHGPELWERKKKKQTPFSCFGMELNELNERLEEMLRETTVGPVSVALRLTRVCRWDR